MIVEQYANPTEILCTLCKQAYATHTAILERDETPDGVQKVHELCPACAINVLHGAVTMYKERFGPLGLTREEVREELEKVRQEEGVWQKVWELSWKLDWLLVHHRTNRNGDADCPYARGCFDQSRRCPLWMNMPGNKDEILRVWARDAELDYINEEDWRDLFDNNTDIDCGWLGCCCKNIPGCWLAAADYAWEHREDKA